MITHEFLIKEINKIPDGYLSEVYELIKNFEEEKKIKSESNLMSKLRSINILAAQNFSQTADLHTLEIDDD